MKRETLAIIMALILLVAVGIEGAYAIRIEPLSAVEEQLIESGFEKDPEHRSIWKLETYDYDEDANTFFILFASYNQEENYGTMTLLTDEEGWNIEGGENCSFAYIEFECDPVSGEMTILNQFAF